MTNHLIDLRWSAPKAAVPLPPSTLVLLAGLPLLRRPRTDR